MNTMPQKIRLGVSTCLLGRNVRYDGGHKHDPYLTKTLGVFVEYVPVCPEVECGMPIPRESLRLVGDIASPRLVTTKTGKDFTSQMQQWARQRLDELETENLCGFIFKSDSPSSGMERVKVYLSSGMPVKKGSGIFARMFMERFPLLPVEEEGRLHDPGLRENFIERIFVLQRWRNLCAENPTVGGLVTFHTDHKLLLLAHSPEHYRKMGKLVADASRFPIRQTLDGYAEMLMTALKIKASPRKNVNVLQHALGYFKKELSSEEKQEALTLIEQYGQGLLPLIVPITLIHHFIRKYQEPYLSRQLYFQPHPIELQLRNHV
ncbi:DUF523 and DUF1722 domain-containing protein [Desulfatirhabdium butyrativorans]|uniref:YbgA family protein n=1 Tax=Desulfatirhabdium butyrativorans TaxID=340467 RepID=UPI0004099E83